MKQGKRIMCTILALVLAAAMLSAVPSAYVYAEEAVQEPAAADSNTGTGEQKPAVEDGNTGTGEQGPAVENGNTDSGEQKPSTGGNTGNGKAIPNIRLSVGDGQTVPQYQAGEEVTLILKLTNQGTVSAKNVRISPVINDANDWPFELKNLNEEQKIDEITAVGTEGASAEVKWVWTVRGNVESKAYKLLFDISYQDDKNEYNVSKQVYVKTIAKEAENQTPEPVPGTDENGGVVSDGGAVYNSDPIVSGGGGSGNTSVPRVIVTGFSTNPGAVTAGSNFTLTVHVKNTSSVTAVSNMLFDLQAPSAGTEAAAEAPAFLPASGSSSIYLDCIPAGETRDISIEMNARADLLQKPYSIAMSMKYEDSSATQFEGSSSLAVPVQQNARFEFSDIEVAPDSIQVGEEANLTCSLYNTGRTKLYNVKVQFTGDGISAKDVFVGNVESGSTGTIDAMIMGESEVAAGTKCKMTVSFEDETGKVSTKEEQFELEVLPAAVDSAMDMMSEPVVEEKGFPVLPAVAVVIVIAAVAAGVLLIRRKKKKQAWAEEEDLADEVDRLTEDE